MFFRLKKSGQRGYVQIVENKRDGAAVRQKVIANIAGPTNWPPPARSLRSSPRAPSSPIRCC